MWTVTHSMAFGTVCKITMEYTPFFPAHLPEWYKTRFHVPTNQQPQPYVQVFPCFHTSSRH